MRSGMVLGVGVVVMGQDLLAAKQTGGVVVVQIEVRHVEFFVAMGWGTSRRKGLTGCGGCRVRAVRVCVRGCVWSAGVVLGGECYGWLEHRQVSLLERWSLA